MVFCLHGSVEFTVTVTFSPFVSDEEPLPDMMYYRMWTKDGEGKKHNGNIDRASSTDPSHSTFQLFL